MFRVLYLHSEIIFWKSYHSKSVPCTVEATVSYTTGTELSRNSLEFCLSWSVTFVFGEYRGRSVTAFCVHYRSRSTTELFGVLPEPRCYSNTWGTTRVDLLRNSFAYYLLWSYFGFCRNPIIIWDTIGSDTLCNARDIVGVDPI